MAIKLFACILVAVATAAPSVPYGANWQRDIADLNRLQEAYRTKRSGYGNVYMSPCAAAAASSPIPAYAAGVSSAYASAPVSAYASASHSTPYTYSQQYQVPTHKGLAYNYGHPYYRSEEEQENDQEIMNFSDMNHATFDHMPTARYSYGAAPSTGGSSGGSSGSGQAVGVFPNANTGGCSVPLLVSCSPSIAHGRMVKSQPYYDSASSYQGNMYRVVDDHPHHEETVHQANVEHSIPSHDLKQKSDTHQ